MSKRGRPDENPRTLIVEGLLLPAETLDLGVGCKEGHLWFFKVAAKLGESECGKLQLMICLIPPLETGASSGGHQPFSQT